MLPNISANSNGLNSVTTSHESNCCLISIAKCAYGLLMVAFTLTVAVPSAEAVVDVSDTDLFGTRKLREM